MLPWPLDREPAARIVAERLRGSRRATPTLRLSQLIGQTPGPSAARHYTEPVTRYLIDAAELGRNPKGVARVLASLTPRLITRSPDTIFVACAVPSAAEAAGIPIDRVVSVKDTLQSRWEQWGLPRVALELDVAAVYSHRESGALWGPPLVLHVPEDPEVRWERDPPDSAREHIRRAYSRATMRRALGRAVVAASTAAAAAQLSRRYGLTRGDISIIPLGVDLDLFFPDSAPRADSVFHLGSSDPRDRTLAVVEGWAAARGSIGDLPRLVIGGGLGELAERVRQRAEQLGVDATLTGRLGDEELARQLRHAAVVVQPSSDEGFGLQPLEAMASAAPLVVSRADAVLEVVDDCAIVCEATASGLADGIVKALQDASRLRRVARTRAERFTWDASADAVLRALETAALLGRD
jgi:glycosyltransferase involved in cell wall biosynthesis